MEKDHAVNVDVPEAHGAPDDYVNDPNETKRPAQVGVPHGFREVTSNLGPGLVLAMTFLGTGDLVASSVSGANYGYALMWSLAIALVCRTFVVSSISKYALMNRFGDTSILQGYRRIFKFFPALLSALILFVGFMTQMGFIRAASEAFYHLFFDFGGHFGTWGIFVAGCIVMLGIALMSMAKNQIKILEYIARIASVTIIVFFVIALVRVGRFDVGEFLKGMTPFRMPSKQSGAFAAIAVAVSTIGAVAGSATNLLYPGFMKDKGWTDARYRKVQTIDLLTGMAPLLIINLLFWVVAAEVEWRHGGSISNTADLAHMMETVMGGKLGSTMLWICVFLAAFTSIPSQCRGFAQLTINGFHIGTDFGKKRMEKYGEDDEKDPMFRVLQIGLFLILPLIVTMPHGPDLVALNVVGNATATAFMLLFIVIGLIIMTSSKKYMKDYAVNKWWELLILLILAAISFWSLWELLLALPKNFHMLFNLVNLL